MLDSSLEKVDFEKVEEILSGYNLSLIDFINIKPSKYGTKYATCKMFEDRYDFDEDSWDLLIHKMKVFNLFRGTIRDFGGRWKYDEHAFVI